MKPILIFATTLLAAAAANAAPGWASKPDTADEAGHTFICSGQGKTEEEAYAAAQGICNDKICKVCGVEVESVTETKETLTGVDFQRKVIERCRRVRSADTQVLFKSSDCGPDGCNAWVQIRYTKEDEQRECPRYQKEDFADPAACEKDIDAFSKLEGRTARSFRARTDLLDAALIHCDKIDVRPTPAILALDAKLGHGMDLFEIKLRPGADPYSRSFESWYLAAYEPLRREIAETKFLTGRIRLVRDYVHNKALVFDVIEATTAKDWGTPAGLARMNAALEKAPPGSQYGASRVHFVGLFEMGHSKVDTSMIGATLRKLFPPDKLDPEESWNMALYFGGDEKVTEEEWRYVFAVHRHHRCDNCLRVLLEKEDHGSPQTRIDRFFEAWNSVPAKDRENPKRAYSVFKTLTGYRDPSLVLALEPKLPPEVSAQFDYKYFYDFMTRFRSETKEATKKATVARAAKALAVTPPARTDGRGEDDRGCYSLGADLKFLSKLGADVQPVRPRVCECLLGFFKGKDSYSNKSDLEEQAEKNGMACKGSRGDQAR